MRVRVISSDNCPICQDYLRRLQQQRDFSFEIYDGRAPENQSQLDQWRITEMPVVQIVKEDGTVMHQFLSGGVSTRTIQHIMNKLNK